MVRTVMLEAAENEAIFIFLSEYNASFSSRSIRHGPPVKDEDEDRDDAVEEAEDEAEAEEDDEDEGDEGVTDDEEGNDNKDDASLMNTTSAPLSRQGIMFE